MDFSYTEEQSLFVASCERLVRERCSFETRRREAAAAAETPSPLWPEFAALGLTALRVPEDLGGLGRPLIDGVLAAQALGRGWRQFDGTAAAELEAPVAAAATLAQGAAAIDAWRVCGNVARVGRLAEGIGLAKTVMELTAEYLRTRKQFGQPIGRFQALAHRMADLAIGYEQAQSLLLAAAMQAEAADGARALDAAQVMAHRALRAIGQESIQLHGGIGMTDEYAVSHYVKRLLAIEIELGDADTVLARFAAAA